MKLKDKYQIEETTTTFSFKPFYHYRKKIIWYLLAIVILGISSFYFFRLENVTLLIIANSFLLVIFYFFVNELFILIPIKYTFYSSENAVYKSNLFYTNKKIITLSKIEIFRNIEMGSFCYKMGEKKKQFVKNFIISENFTNKENNNSLIAFNVEILNKIEKMKTQQQNKISITQSNLTYNS